MSFLILADKTFSNEFSREFDSIFNDCINSMEEASQNYQDVITEVNEQVGITYEDLAN